MALRHAAREEIVFSGAGAKDAFDRCFGVLWSYRFYPPHRVTGEFVSETGGPVKGALIQQRIRVGPLHFRGPVLIVDVWDHPTPRGRTAGYGYEALPGHVERGTSSFRLKLEGDEVIFRIESHSAPAHWLARLFAPLARLLQRRGVAKAFAAMRHAARDAADR